ncbi:hypothetical protein Cgig2_007193 [Carnegiea gigantea]|uniref:RNA polymerase Rpb7-like N-terminal domain-containing protein n=1 Tax=Carnegiea gigantea TaxID=171969 RepID=A0A9Q1GJQ7_9CARY|nr:hypothetical protein Cgig2_007193 [Carnegiea gigantea]
MLQPSAASGISSGASRSTVDCPCLSLIRLLNSCFADIPDLPDLAFPPSPVEPGRDSTQTTRLLQRVERIREGMFALSLLEHKLRVPACKLGLPLEDAIRGELESIFMDKVIIKLGLCVSSYDIKSIDGGFILPNEGSPTYTLYNALYLPCHRHLHLADDGFIRKPIGATVLVGECSTELSLDVTHQKKKILVIFNMSHLDYGIFEILYSITQGIETVLHGSYVSGPDLRAPGQLPYERRRVKFSFDENMKGKYVDFILHSVPRHQQVVEVSDV